MRPIGRSGQFAPITAMVMFTTMISLVAVVNVYKVSKAKLQVQNLADAAALNVASQMVASLNKAIDLNEWMNHITEPPSGTPTAKPGEAMDCRGINPDLPPLSCAENSVGSKNLNMFSSLKNAQAYARLIQKINQAQQMFIDTYNNFIGSGLRSRGSSMSNSSLQSILLGDIPELAQPGTYLSIGNTEPLRAQRDLNKSAPPPKRFDADGMQDMTFKTHDVMIGYWKTRKIGGGKVSPQFRTLGDVLYGQEGRRSTIPESAKIGWKELDLGPMAPQINVDPTRRKFRYGAWAKVTRDVEISVFGLGRTIQVSAEARAYIVEGSGSQGSQSGMKPDPRMPGVYRPVFKPTYWVKLVGGKG